MKPFRFPDSPEGQQKYIRRRRARARRHDSLKIGGLDETGRQRQASPLELAGDPAAPNPATSLWVAWDQIPDAFEFSRRQRAVWRCLEHGNETGRELGLNPHEFAATKREIMRMLKRNRAQLGPFIGYLTGQELYLQKRWGTDGNQAGLSGIGGSHNLKLTELHEQLVAERAKLGRLTANVERARVAHREAETNVDVLEASTIAERTAAAFEEREISEDLGKRLAAARAKVVTTETTLSAARAAVTRQAAVVDGIASEVEGRRHEQLIKAVATPRSEALEALRICADKFHSLDRAISENGGAHLDLIFPPRDPGDREADWAERQDLFNLMCAIIRFDWGRPRTGDLGFAYHRRGKVA